MTSSTEMFNSMVSSTEGMVNAFIPWFEGIFAAVLVAVMIGLIIRVILGAGRRITKS